MHVMYVGAVGAGKTFCAVADAIEDKGDFIVSNVPMAVDDQNELAGKTVDVWERFDDDAFINSRCGALVLDEAPLWLDARKFEMLSGHARRKIIEHRKDDLFIVSTAQHIAFIDKVFRILCDEVRLVERRWFPFIGWIWPKCVRPTIICKDCGRIRRDGEGDDSHFIKRLFGVGTYYRWSAYPVTVIGAEESAAGDALNEEKAVRKGRRLFDIHIASAYDTHAKLSPIAAAALRKKRRETTPRTPEHILDVHVKSEET